LGIVLGSRGPIAGVDFAGRVDIGRAQTHPQHILGGIDGRGLFVDGDSLLVVAGLLGGVGLGQHMIQVLDLGPVGLGRLLLVLELLALPRRQLLERLLFPFFLGLGKIDVDDFLLAVGCDILAVEELAILVQRQVIRAENHADVDEFAVLVRLHGELLTVVFVDQQDVGGGQGLAVRTDHVPAHRHALHQNRDWGHKRNNQGQKQRDFFHAVNHPRRGMDFMNAWPHWGRTQ